MDDAVDPTADEKRLGEVRRFALLDTPPDGAFDRITSLAARIFDVPISIVSIVDHDRIWFKSHHGIDVEPRDFSDEELATMKDLAAVVMDEMELRLEAQRLFLTLRERNRTGIELNDDVVQSLAVAKFALDTGDVQRAHDAVESALGATKRIASALYAEDDLQMDTSDLVRREASAPISRR